MYIWTSSGGMLRRSRVIIACNELSNDSWVGFFVTLGHTDQFPFQLRDNDNNWASIPPPRSWIPPKPMFDIGIESFGLHSTFRVFSHFGIDRKEKLARRSSQGDPRKEILMNKRPKIVEANREQFVSERIFVRTRWRKYSPPIEAVHERL